MANWIRFFQKADQGMQPVEGQPGTFAFPESMDAADVFPAEDLNTQRGIPVYGGNVNTPEMANARASAEYEEANEPRRQQMTQDFIDGGMDPVEAELRASKLFELDRPTIRLAAGGVMSPFEFVSNFVESKASEFGIPEDGVDAAIDDALAQIVTGSGGSELSQEAQQMMLLMLQTNATGGPDSDRSGIKEEEFRRLEQKHGNNANFMYPESQRTNFDALRQYELLTHGTDLFEPGHTSNEVLKFAGGVFNPDGLFAGSFTPGLAPDTPAGDALYWYKQSRNTKSDEPGYHSYRDPYNNDARFWSHSTTTMTGLAGGMGGDTSRVYGRAAAYTMPLGQNPTVPKRDRQFLTDVRTNTNRPVPIIPTGKTPQEMARYHEDAKAYDEASRDWLPSAYAKTFGSRPTGFQNLFFDMIHDATDPATVVDAAATTAFGGLGGAVRGARQAGKGVLRNAGLGAAAGAGAAIPQFVGEEAAYSAATGAALSPLSPGFYTQPVAENPLAMREGGGMAQPYDDDYGAVTRTNMSNYRSALDKAADRYYRKRK